MTDDLTLFGDDPEPDPEPEAPRPSHWDFDDPAVEASLVPKRVRRSDPATSAEGAKAVSIRAGSQKAKLLRAFADADADGVTLTDEDAAARAELPVRSCFWKRCGELREAGLIEFTGDTRMASAGVNRNLSRITEAGREALG